MKHAEIEELLGTYALDAVDAEEALAVEEHLATCPRCRAEVAAHREVAALLGNSGGAAPEGLWEQIAGALEGDFSELPAVPDLEAVRAARAPAVPGPSVSSSGSGRPLARRRLRPVAISLGALAAALAVVVGLLADKVGSLEQQVTSITSALSTNGIAQQAALAVADPQHRSVVLAPAAGERRAVLVLLPSGQAYLMNEGALHALPGDHTYQLWALVSGRLVSVGLLGSSPGDVPVRVTSNMTKFMVTAEPLGGTVQPTSPVVVQGNVGSA
ncbi:MAG: hypothetical protein JWO62_3181 [Acidimicrobiaceae bacterium]|jgi:hypothetical protein|nr:hypothetical protein [Acidimicrobiaceae bacterium]